MRGAAFQVFKTVRAIPGAVWATMAIFAFVWSVWAFAVETGVRAEKARTEIAVIQDEVRVEKAQGALNELAIKRLDDSIVHKDRIDERTTNARRQLDAVKVASSGNAFADRLAALRAYRDVAVRLRDDILASREDYVADQSTEDAPRGMRASRPSYG
jgi:hypothetical protein